MFLTFFALFEKNLTLNFKISVLNKILTQKSKKMNNQGPNIHKFDTKTGFYYENRHNLNNIYEKCLKRFNQEGLFAYEKSCVENYTKMLKEAIPIVVSQLTNDF